MNNIIKDNLEMHFTDNLAQHLKPNVNVFSLLQFLYTMELDVFLKISVLLVLLQLENDSFPNSIVW